MPVSSPRSTLRSSMEQPNREGHSPGRTPQSPECSGIPGGQECSLKRTHADLEHNLGRILLGPDFGSEKPLPSADPNPLPLPLSPPTLSDLGQPQKLPLTATDKQYPLMKQRGFYSDILSPGSLEQIGVSVAAVPYQIQVLPWVSFPPSLPSISLSIHLFTHPSSHLSVL